MVRGAATRTPAIRAGEPARVAVAVAGAWRTPDAPRELDRPALENPPDIPAWLGAQDDDQKRDLVGRLDTQALLGEPVRVMDVHRGWALVLLGWQPAPWTAGGIGGLGEYEAWIPAAQLDAGPLTGWGEVMHWATVTAPTTRLEIAPDATIALSFGTSLPVLGAGPERVEVGLPGGGRGFLSGPDVVLHAPEAPAIAPSGASVVETMRRFLGLPYLWAGTSGFGFDCSGLVHLVHRVHGIELPRDTGPMSQVGAIVGPDDRRPGDLVFFERNGDVHHVVTWLGDGRVIESPKTGLGVREIALVDLPYAHEVTVTRRVLAGA